MQDKEPELNKKPEPQAESVFAKEKTFGEKKHAQLFGTVINFWVNLVASAGFSFWVAHSTNKIKLPFIEKEFAPLREMQTNLGKWIEKQSVMKAVASDPLTRAERSQSLATLFTLLTPGHFIMIPSVYLGAKYKAAIVKHYDRQHYGDEAMASPELQKRHEAIEQEDKPTLLGAVVSRTGSFMATQFVGALIGTPDNWLNKLGAKSFRGVDPIAIDIGGTVSEGLHKIAPETLTKFDNHIAKRGYSWSNSQLKSPTMAQVTKGAYNQPIDNFSRYLTTDVLYTLVTSTTVHPILNLAKKFIPGLTYTPKPKASHVKNIAPQVVKDENAQEITFEQTQETQKASDTIPAAIVSNISAESTITAKPDRSVAVAGA